MNFSLKEIAKIINGKVIGDSNIKINALSKIEEGKEGSLCFIANMKYEQFLYSTKASAVIISSNLKLNFSKISTNLILVNDPYQSFASLLKIVGNSRKNIEAIHHSSIIQESATIGSNCYVGSNAYIGNNVVIGNNVKIFPNCYLGDDNIVGDNTILYAGVKIYYNCSIGKNCILQSGSIVGSDGFGFAPNNKKEYTKIIQIGNVIIEDNVEIGANTTIDRATMGSTVIRNGVKLDNLIQIAHNVEIGKHTVIAAQTGIAGSTKIGENCMIGGQVGIIGHLNIGNNVKIAAQSGVQSDIKNNEIVQGSPAFPISEYKRSYVLFKQLPKLNSLVNKIEKKFIKIFDK
tara:strand:- start:3246 stop:4283 length:1038 start_codon:yes stop_codon:yes gene_type:complete